MATMHQVGHKLFARCCLFCGRWSAAACDFITLTPRIRGSLLCPYVVSWTNLKFLLCLGRVLKFKCACAPCHHATCVVAICAVSLNTYTSIYARRYLNLFGVSRPIPYHTIPYHTIPYHVYAVFIGSAAGTSVLLLLFAFCLWLGECYKLYGWGIKCIFIGL